MITDKQLINFLNQTNNLSKKFKGLLDETDGKLQTIIETSLNLQIKLEPLNRNIDQYQNALKNMDTCRSELTKTQSFNRTGLEVESIINKSPSGNIDNYLLSMDKIKSAMDFFQINDPKNVEFVHLTALYTSGKDMIEKEFEGILNQAFPVLRPESIFSMCFYKDNQTDSDSIASSFTDIFDNVAEHHVIDLKKISQWLLEDKTINCVVRYCTCRRDTLRLTMERFKDWCKSSNHLDQSVYSLRNKASVLKSTKRKAISKRNIVISKEVNHRRQGSEVKDDFEEKESNLFIIRLVALVKLIQIEKKWLERLNLTPEFKDKCGAMDAIIKGCTNDFLNDGLELLKLMNRAQAKHQYHYVINLIIVLERFMEVKIDLNDILQTSMESTRHSMYNLVYKLTQQILQCLEVYIEYIKTEKITAIDGTCVPSDATVHELTTNALRFLETLISHGNIVELILSNVEIAEKIIQTTGKSMNKSKSHLSKASLNINVDSANHQSLMDYINKIIEGLIRNITNMSLNYTDEISRLIFQINNMHYILKTIDEPEFLGNYPQSKETLLDNLNQCINQKKFVYIATFVKASNIPEPKSYQGLISSGSKIDNNLKIHIKDIWTRFNQSFMLLVKSHSLYALPDKDLRKALINDLQLTFVQKYVNFRDAFMPVSFTTKREKYIIYSKEEIENYLNRFFTQ